VVDTNILISAFLWGGIPAAVLMQCLTLKIQLLHTDDTLEEFVKTLNKPKFDKQLAARQLTRDIIIDRYPQFSTLVLPADVPDDAVSDPKDMIILAAAVGGNADALITGDDHLLRLKTFGNTRILTAAQFLAILNPPADTPAAESQKE